MRVAVEWEQISWASNFGELQWDAAAAPGLTCYEYQGGWQKLVCVGKAFIARKCGPSCCVYVCPSGHWRQHVLVWKSNTGMLIVPKPLEISARNDEVEASRVPSPNPGWQ